MRYSRTSQESQQNTIEEAYRRGYHHGLFQALDLVQALLFDGIPVNAATELCQAFIERVVIPWRATADRSSSLPPHFDLEECQRFLREMKQDQSH